MRSGPSPAGRRDGLHLGAGESWLDRLHAQRACLKAAVPARSDDPVLYRALIYTSAEGVLRDGINAEPSDADSNDAFRAAYPEYFAQPGASANLLHQRFRRAREDVKALLQAVVRARRTDLNHLTYAACVRFAARPARLFQAVT